MPATLRNRCVRGGITIVSIVVAVLCATALDPVPAGAQESKAGTRGLFDDIPAQNLGDSERSCTNTDCFYLVAGEISADSVTRFASFLDSRPKGATVTMFFGSPGGDLAAAMDLGRLIRRNPPVIGLVAPSTTCSSACVLSLLGATSRKVGGRIGIHRPFTLSTAPSNLEERQQAFRRMERSVRDYLAEMNIPSSLLDEMLRYEAHSMHYMSKAELTRFRIEGTDHVWQDQVDTDMARRYGLDKKTYLARKSLSESRCKADFSSTQTIRVWMDCQAATMRGD